MTKTESEALDIGFVTQIANNSDLDRILDITVTEYISGDWDTRSKIKLIQNHLVSESINEVSLEDIWQSIGDKEFQEKLNRKSL